MPGRYYIWTIGCQMNKAESERLTGYLEHLGYQPATNAEDADLILLNSCVVRQSAENRVVNKIHALKALKKIRPGITIALTGCLVDSNIEQLRKSFPSVDYFFTAGSFPEWLGDFEPEYLLPRNPQVATLVPIMQGCNNFCSYCIVPYRRGRERSRPIDEIVCEVKGLIQRGVKEITLLGQNVNSYGQDLPERSDLTELLTQLNTLPGLLRIRFLTNHPKDMQNRLIEAVKSLDKVCEQINLPVQAGDNEILKAMRRGYTVEQYIKLIEQIRTKIPDISLSTDVIVGFPGETINQFLNTYNLLSGIKFDMVHVAAYSPRTGTLAAREMMDDVPAEVKKERLEKIEQLQADVIGQINARMLHQVVEVLVEGKEKGKWSGRTRGDKVVFFSSSENYQSQLIQIKITHTSPWSLSGELASVDPSFGRI
jgi:tRNA-2-methylthio-N6-dimethylallyladenosine synthase